jgi:glutamate dehydrogenase/leucine dehydrogenase
MNVYETPAEALLDAMRLSGAMTQKLVVAGIPFGGGNAVIAVPELPIGRQRRALLLRYADLVESLGGTYRTSSDGNTSETDMDRPRARGRRCCAGGRRGLYPPTRSSRPTATSTPPVPSAAP